LKICGSLKFFDFIAATCPAPGPWQASQLTPGEARSNCCRESPAAAAVVWQLKHPCAASRLSGRPKASSSDAGTARGWRIVMSSARGV
jgi:hypothetical protein